LATGTADDRLRQEVSDERQQIGLGRAEAQRKATLLRDLDDARMTRSIWIESHLDYAGSDMKYAAAFAAYGLELKPERTEKVARRIRAEQPAIREALIVALDNWWGTATWASTADRASLVWATAVAADDDAWRRQYRAAAAARDVTALRALSGQARRLSLPPSSLELLAGSLSSQGGRDEALALLRWARGRHLTDFWIHFQLGFLLQQGTDKSPAILEETIGCYRTALALRPAAGAVHNDLGKLLHEKNQVDEAIAEYRMAIDVEPTNAPAHNNLGLALYHKNQLDEAMAEYRMAIDIDPKFAMPHFNLGLAHSAKHQLDEAIAEYGRGIELNPTDVNAWRNRGIVYYALRQWNEALTDFTKATELEPMDVNAWRNRGCVYYVLRQWNKALTDFTKATELEPKNVLAWGNRGNAYVNLRKWDKALAAYSKVVELDRKQTHGWTNRGLAYSQLGQWDKALADFSQAIELDPKFAPAWNNRANAYAVLGLWGKAAADMDQALVPNDPLRWMELASFRLQAGDSAGYQKACAGMLERFGQTKDPIIAHQIALSCLLGSRAERDQKLPVQLAELAAAGAPRDPWCLITRGMALYRAGQFEAAVSQLRRVLKTWPENPFARPAADGAPILTWLVLAMTHQRLGHAEDARLWLNKAVQIMDQELGEKKIGPLREQCHVWAMCLVLRREAEGLLNTRGTDRPTEKK
jgi:tetratricopeptide (TPR) repeat protein